MSYVLRTLTKKQEVDSIIRDTIDKVLVLRFGRSSDHDCLLLDDVVCLFFLIHQRFSLNPFFFLILNFSSPSTQLAKSAREVSKFASVALVDIDSEDIQVYVNYFDITLIPSTIFFFNAHHMKMDSGYFNFLYVYIYIICIYVF